MKNEEIKKKIVEILCKVWIETVPFTAERKFEHAADALIAAGLTFDKTTAILVERTNGKTLILKAQYYDEMKHRAEVAERAGKEVMAYLYGYDNTDDIEKYWQVALKQAEKELEGEDGNQNL